MAAAGLAVAVAALVVVVLVGGRGEPGRTVAAVSPTAAATATTAVAPTEPPTTAPAATSTAVATTAPAPPAPAPEPSPVMIPVPTTAAPAPAPTAAATTSTGAPPPPSSTSAPAAPGSGPTSTASEAVRTAVAAVSADAVPADLIRRTAPDTLVLPGNPINGGRGGTHPLSPGWGCTVDPAAPTPCLVGTLDALGMDVTSGPAAERARRLSQAVAVAQLDQGLAATGVADRALFERLGIWPGSSALGADEVRVIGRSQQGRPIVALRFGSGPNVTIAVGQTHGDEEAGLRVVLRAARERWAAGTTVWLVPTVNPDGLALDTRFLANGHDPNRKAPTEPEQLAFVDFARAVKPRLTVYYHQNYGWVGGSGASRDWSRAYQDVAHLGPLYRSGDCANGFLWCPVDDELGSSSILVELPDVVTPAMVRLHVRALAAVVALP